jgi:hypothetical protein
MVFNAEPQGRWGLGTRGVREPVKAAQAGRQGLGPSRLPRRSAASRRKAHAIRVGVMRANWCPAPKFAPRYARRAALIMVG